MTNKKVTELPEATSANTDSLIYLVGDMDSTPTSKKITVANMKTSLGLTGTNSGDETADSIKTKLGITTLSGSNTGDQTDISGNAATVTVGNEASDTSCYPLFATTTTGSLSPKTNAGLTYNSSTNALTATTFVGALTGTASGNLTSGGALGTPSSGTLTNCTGLPLAGVVDSTTEALGVGTLEVGHASDTTISRSSAGVIAVEGVTVSLNSTSATHTAGTIELGAASDTTISRSSAGVIAVEGTAVPKGTGTTNEIAYWSGTNTVGTLAVATYPSLTELSYVKGVTSAIQTQIGTKVTSGGALGTPSSGTLTNCTGLPVSTGVSGLGTNVATFLATPSSANLAAAVTDETGTGSLVLATTPTISNPKFSMGSLGSNGAYTGNYDTYTSGYTVVLGNLTYLNSSSQPVLADASTESTGKGFIVMATTSIINGNPGVYLEEGTIRNDSWNWTPGAILYLNSADEDVAGTLTETKNTTSGNIVRIMGYAKSATVVKFKPSDDYYVVP